MDISPEENGPLNRGIVGEVDVDAIARSCLWLQPAPGASIPAPRLARQLSLAATTSKCQHPLRPSVRCQVEEVLAARLNRLGRRLEPNPVEIPPGPRLALAARVRGAKQDDRRGHPVVSQRSTQLGWG